MLIGKRKGSHGAGRYALPGGHLEMGESWAQCAARELEEETGIQTDVKSWKFGFVSNDVMRAEDKHYITVFMQCLDAEAKQEAKNLEPHKCEGWKWVDFDSDLKKLGMSSVFLPLWNLLRSEFRPLDAGAMKLEGAVAHCDAQPASE